MDLAGRLRNGFQGVVLEPGDRGYDAARRVANGRVDRRPAVVARCVTAADVAAAVRHGRDAGVPVAVRGGGHHVAGWGSCDGGLLIDLSPLRGVRVDPATRTAAAQAGLRWSDLDAATQQHRLATPGGRSADVGIAGFTLGGGYGELSRAYGLACDNVERFEVVTATGDHVVASADEHPDLFWALRGGGGNFGVVTGFTYRLHPVGPVVSGRLALAARHAPAALRAARDWAAQAPDAASFVAILWTAPAVPLVPEPLHYTPGLLLLTFWAGRPDEGAEVLGALHRSVRGAAPDPPGTIPYLRYQQQLTSPAPYGLLHTYSRAELLGDLSDATIDQVAGHWAQAGPAHSVVLGPLGGAIGRVGGGDTAFAHRDAGWFVETAAQWHPALDGDAHVEHVRRGWQALQAVSVGPYVNQLPDTGPEWVRAAFGANHERLAAVKAVWDPDNVFRVNANVPPCPD